MGQSYRFLHKPLRDFAVAHSICQDKGLLNEFAIIDDHGITDFIIEEAEQNQALQIQLLACVEASKQNPEVSNAAANAITILVRVGKRFHKNDFQGIRIPGADLRTGWFEGAQLQRADLRRVRFDRAWLSGADLTGACIDGGEFGEKPHLRLGGTRRMESVACCYTNEGELLVAAVAAVAEVFGSDIEPKERGDVQVWSATKRKLLYTLRGHTSYITCAAFPSNNNDLLASASHDRTIRLWSRQNQDDQLVHTFDRRKGIVRTIVYSPDAKFLASVEESRGEICLWSVVTHNLIHCYSCDSPVLQVAFSPDGQTPASAGGGILAQLWSIESGKDLYTLQGRSGGDCTMY